MAAQLHVASYPPRVNIVYLVPSDRQVRPDYIEGLEYAAATLRKWYALHTPTAITFTLAEPTVWVVPVPHDARWYADNARPSLVTQFWDNVLSDAFPLTGGAFNSRNDVWAYYIDADPACGEFGGSGTSGVLVVSANDLRGVSGEPTLPDCAGYRDPPGRERWIGGPGHELGHAFGLPHPSGCDQGRPECDQNAFMWNGFRIFPDTYLRADEIHVLENSPFFVATTRRRAVRR